MSLKRKQVRQWIKQVNCTVHNEGRIVLSPPGSGKTHFVKHNHDWVDEDEFLGEEFLKFHTEDWHKVKHTEEEEKAHYIVCDKYLEAMKEEGLWVVGSLFEKFIPNDILILPKGQHRKFVQKRADLEWQSVQKVSRLLQHIAKQHAVPIQTSWQNVKEKHSFLSNIQYLIKNLK